jgi:putative membrane protein
MIERVTAESDSGDVSVELARRRTGMSFQRTRMSADRTLMAVIRTSLALIGFGFTIFQFFAKLVEANLIKGSAHSARTLGLAMAIVGTGMMVMGIAYHLQFMLALRQLRAEMVADGLTHGTSPFPPSLTLITAVVLLAIGVAAVFSMV